MYTYPCLVKRKRATLESDPLRDNQMRLRRISVWGSLTVSPPTLLGYIDIQSYLLCLKNYRGLGTESPDTFAFFRSGKFHFTLNQDKTTTYAWDDQENRKNVQVLFDTLWKRSNLPGLEGSRTLYNSATAISNIRERIFVL